MIPEVHTRKITPSSAIEVINGFPRSTHGDLSIETPINHGKYGVAFSARLREARVAVKVYFRRSPLIFKDPALDEFEKCAKVNNDFPKSSNFLQKPKETVKIPQWGRVFISELVTDFDGTISRPLFNSKCPPASFFDSLQAVLSAFADRPVLCRVGMFNILVRWIAKDSAIPVLIDFQSYESYAHFPGLAFRHLTRDAKRQDMHHWNARTISRIKARFSESVSLVDQVEALPPLPDLSAFG